MIPFIRNSPIHTLNIPEMSGGVNLRDSLTLVNDNQLTECKNMWFKDGMLKTRPAVKGFDSDNVKKDWEGSCKFFPDVKVTDDFGNEKILFANIDFDEEGYIKANFSLVGEYSSTSMGSYTFGGGVLDSSRVNIFAYLWKNDIYVFLGSKLYEMDGEYEFGYSLLKSECDIFGNYQTLKEIDLDKTTHVPRVYTNAYPTGLNEPLILNGNMVGAYNLINRYYKIEYSTVNPDIETSVMKYKLPESVVNITDDVTITAKFTTGDINNPVIEHTVNLKNGVREESSSNDIDKLKMKVGADYVAFYKSDGQIATKSKSEFVFGDLEITAPRSQRVSPDDAEIVFGMSESVWFGGASSGLAGGTRLFLGNNTNKNNKNSVIWSDLNNPLYFPVDNNFRVGKSNTKVTAFGKQDKTLVIFKPDEIFYTYYQQGDAVTYEDVENQNVLELTSISAMFPLVQISQNIGCDLPETIQLCRNKLVWASSGGKIYTLVSQNQYSERCVFAVSEMLGDKLKSTNLEYASAIDYDNKYILFADNKAFVMDYNSHGFNYVYSYSKAEDANKLVPWHIWELPIHCSSSILLKDRAIMTGWEGTEYSKNFGYFILDKSNCEDEWFVFNEEGNAETQKEYISCSITTKLFDFGQPARLKSVPIVNISFGDNEGRPITVDFISEKNIKDQHSVNLIGANEEIYSPGYSNSVRFFPWTKGSVKFGINISCDGELSIDAITLQYKTLGGAK